MLPVGLAHVEIPRTYARRHGGGAINGGRAAEESGGGRGGLLAYGIRSTEPLPNLQ